MNWIQKLNEYKTNIYNQKNYTEIANKIIYKIQENNNSSVNNRTKLIDLCKNITNEFKSIRKFKTSQKVHEVEFKPIHNTYADTTKYFRYFYWEAEFIDGTIIGFVQTYRYGYTGSAVNSNSFGFIECIFAGYSFDYINLLNSFNDYYNFVFLTKQFKNIFSNKTEFSFYLKNTFKWEHCYYSYGNSNLLFENSKRTQINIKKYNALQKIYEYKYKELVSTKEWVIALTSGEEHLIRMCINKGINVNEFVKEGISTEELTPLEYTIYTYTQDTNKEIDFKIITLLLENGANPNKLSKSSIKYKQSLIGIIINKKELIDKNTKEQYSTDKLIKLLYFYGTKVFKQELNNEFFNKLRYHFQTID